MLLKKYLLNEFNLDTFDNYFDIFEHKMNTRNNKHSIRLPPVKLELAHQGLFSLQLPVTGALFKALFQFLV